MRVDKTLSELWHLRGSDDDEAADTAFLAINTIKRLLEENQRLNAQIDTWKKAFPGTDPHKKLDIHIREK